jgi:hypothetical protein
MHAKRSFATIAIATCTWTLLAILIAVVSGSHARNEHVGSVEHALGGCPESANQRYREYIDENHCDGGDNDCLDVTSYTATRSDGRRVTVDGVFRWRRPHDSWRAYGESAARPQLLPHYLGEYLKKLRNAYEVCPELFEQVYNQVDYMVTESRSRDGAVVWENRLGIAQGMEQAEIALRFAALARHHHRHGHDKEARGTMAYALRAARSVFLAVGVRTGGVASVNQAECAAKTARLRPCIWFHSRGRDHDTRANGEPDVATVLNQHLHIVRDVLDLSVALRQVQSESLSILPADLPPPAGPWTSWADALENRAVAGLYLLAFSNGHKAVAPTRPPNIAQFMKRHGGSQPFFSAYYNFDLTTGERLEDSTREGTCHYQGHVLNLLAAIWTNAHDDYNDGALSAANGWRVLEALDRLVEGRGEAVGLTDSTHAVYQLYRTEEPYYRNDRWGCGETPSDGSKPEKMTEESRVLFEAILGPW